MMYSDFYSGGYKHSPNGHQRRETVHDHKIQIAKQWVLAAIYAESAPPSGMAAAQRDAEIARRYSLGSRLSDLAREYGISPQRVFQILKKSADTTGDTPRPDVAETSKHFNPDQFVRPEADPDAGDSASIDSKE